MTKAAARRGPGSDLEEQIRMLGGTGRRAERARDGGRQWERWLKMLRGDPPGETLAADWRRWLNDLYAMRGELTRDEVEALASSTIQARAGRACDLVVAEVLATLGESVRASTMLDDGSNASLLMIGSSTAPDCPRSARTR
jgi:hypothetical protein